MGRITKSRKIYLESGSLRMISWSCSANPISNNLKKKINVLEWLIVRLFLTIQTFFPQNKPYLSASSNTVYSMVCSFNSISTIRWRNLPGVAIILEKIYNSQTREISRYTIYDYVIEVGSINLVELSYFTVLSCCCVSLA